MCHRRGRLGPRLQVNKHGRRSIRVRKANTKMKRLLLQIHEHSNPYKFQAARRRKGNLYKSKQSSTGTHNDLNKFAVEELIPEGSQAQPFVCMAMLLNFFSQKQTV